MDFYILRQYIIKFYIINVVLWLEKKGIVIS